MDRRKFNGGHSTRGRAGRKKGSGLSGVIKKHVDNFMNELIKEPSIQEKLQESIAEITLHSGWIYIIKDNDTELTKIGVTQRSNPNQRLNLYSCHNMDIQKIYIDNVENCFELEEEVLISLERKRVKGDWFDLNDEDVLKVISIINKSKYQKYF